MSRAEAKQMVIDTLKENHGRMKASDLDSIVKSASVSGKTLERAKKELKSERIIQYDLSGFGSTWFVSLTNFNSE